MTMTLRDATSIVEHLAAAYRQTEKLPPATVAAYAAGLQDLDRETVLSATERLIRTTRWFPTIAEIRAAASPPVEDAAVGWERALMWARNGSYGLPPPRNTVWGRCCYALGLERMAQESPRFLLPRFLELYAQMAETERVGRAVGVLPGPADHSRIPSAVRALVATVAGQEGSR